MTDCMEHLTRLMTNAFKELEGFSGNIVHADFFVRQAQQLRLKLSNHEEFEFNSMLADYSTLRRAVKNRNL